MSNPDTRDVRAILNELGIGDFNATMVIPLVFMAPAQSDPDMTQVKLLTKAMQKTMQRMGAQIIANGRIDQPTADCLQALAGSHWNGVVWFDLAKMLLTASSTGRRFTSSANSGSGSGSGSAHGVTLQGLGATLPDVPGGLFTIAVGSYLLYSFFKKGS